MHARFCQEWNLFAQWYDSAVSFQDRSYDETRFKTVRQDINHVTRALNRKLEQASEITTTVSWSGTAPERERERERESAL